MEKAKFDLNLIQAGGIDEKLSLVHADIQPTKQDREILDLAFSKMIANKPGWRAAFKTKEEVVAYKKELGATLFQNGIKTMFQLECGIAGLRASEGDFLPSTGKFARWCNSGIPLSDHEVELLFNQAAHRNFKDDLAYHAYVRMDAFEFRQASSSEARKLFEKALARALKEISEGHVIKIPPPVAGHLEIKPSTPEKRNEFMKQLWGILR